MPHGQEPKNLPDKFGFISEYPEIFEEICLMLLI